MSRKYGKGNKTDGSSRAGGAGKSGTEQAWPVAGAEEHEAYLAYIGLMRQMEDMERLQIYFRGHTDAVAYLKKIKAI